MLERSSYPGYVTQTENPGIYRVRRDIVGQPLISIIITNTSNIINNTHASLSSLENCIRSIKELTTYNNYEIIVATSLDLPKTTLENIAACNLQIVKCSESSNISIRINAGTAQAKGEFLLLLNENTEVITPEWLQSMLELAQQTEIGAVGAKLLSPNKTVQHVGIIILEGNPYHAFNGFDADDAGYHCSNIVNKNYLAVSSACLMIRQKLFQELGKIDENFSFYYYDIDLCLKAHQTGYRNIVTPYAQLIYNESASYDKAFKAQELSKLHKRWNKYFHDLRSDPYYNINLSSKSANFEIFEI